MYDHATAIRHGQGIVHVQDPKIRAQLETRLRQLERTTPPYEPGRFAPVHGGTR